MTSKRLSLLHLAKPLGEVELLIDGTARWVPIVAIDGTSMHAVALAEQEGKRAPDVDECYRIGAQVLPSLTLAQVKQLNAPTLETIITIASGQADLLMEHHDPNGAGPSARQETPAATPASPPPA